MKIIPFSENYSIFIVIDFGMFLYLLESLVILSLLQRFSRSKTVNQFSVMFLKKAPDFGKQKQKSKFSKN